MISAVAHNYAQALAEVASETGQTDRIMEELESFEGLLPPGSELERALLNPTVPLQPKRRIIEDIAGRASYSVILVNFILTLLQNTRLEHFAEIVEAYREELDRRKGILRAVVHSSNPLTDEVRRRLEDEMVRRFGGRTIRFDYRLDESLIGGLKIQVGSTVLDGSIRAQLDKIRRRISSS